MTTTPAPEYLTYEQAAAAYNTSQFVLRRLASDGHLTRHRSARDGRRVLLDRAELERYFSINVPRAS